ncbi:hypothetical protein AXG93_4343s1090 [Marchantia polymorpha subsp. ruderalis]|uniref:Uncharacterized protein n=1 Tax=Marchantia polymorpha subsp. ruderalis TaxID=1480154 RepID=A0A176VU62_MARPO|nr:hypothetical protein AXG93_4343s1090 [Marchantia polymorpha subsp. ruderalis]
MAPKKSNKVRKLVPLKVPYVKLRSFRRELIKLRLDFLLWNWNCVSASICKEIMDKNATEGEELQVTNGWKTTDYLDPKRRAIALGIMHILRQARTTDGRSQRRMAKRRKVVSDDEGDLALEVRRTQTEVEVIKQLISRARPKKRANRGWVAAEVSDSSVEKTVAPIVNTPKVAVGESTPPVKREGTSGVLIKVSADAPAEPLKEGTEIVARTVVDAADIALPSSPVEDVRPEEETKTLEEQPKELVVSLPDFLQDSVVPLLKYLDRKREKYVVSKEAGFYD